MDESLGEEVLLLLFRHPGNMARSGETANLTFVVTRDELCLQREVQSAGSYTDVIAPPPGELFSETNDNSVAILLTYGTARVLLAGDAEAREEEYMASSPCTRS
jgi:beta-lactamase superfamily II metal-dependent hydrolase